MSTNENAVVLRREFAAITIPDVQALLDRRKNDLSDLADIDICSEEMAEEAQEILGRVASAIDEIDEERKTLTRPLREGEKWVNDGFRGAIDSLQAQLNQGKTKLQTWNLQVAEQKKKADEAARAEQKKKADAIAAEAKKLQDDAEALKRAAEAAQAEGNAEAAADLFAQAGEASADARDAQDNAHQVATMPVAAPMASGVKGARKTWKGRVLDKQALLLAAANRPELRGIFMVDESALNAFAKLNENNMHVPGVEFYEEESIAVKRR